MYRVDPTSTHPSVNSTRYDGAARNYADHGSETAKIEERDSPSTRISPIPPMSLIGHGKSTSKLEIPALFEDDVNNFVSWTPSNQSSGAGPSQGVGREQIEPANNLSTLKGKGRSYSISNTDVESGQELDSDQPSNGRSSKTANDSPDLQLSCPYMAYHGRKIGIKQPCSSSSWPDLVRLKEHIKRKHMRFQCDQCSVLFKTKEELQEHENSRASTPCSRNRREVTAATLEYNCTYEQWKEFRRVDRGMLRDQSLEKIYSIVFPDTKERGFPPFYFKTQQALSEDAFQCITTELSASKLGETGQVQERQSTPLAVWRAWQRHASTNGLDQKSPVIREMISNLERQQFEEMRPFGAEQATLSASSMPWLDSEVGQQITATGSQWDVGLSSSSSRIHSLPYYYQRDTTYMTPMGAVAPLQADRSTYQTGFAGQQNAFDAFSMTQYQMNSTPTVSDFSSYSCRWCGTTVNLHNPSPFDCPGCIHLV